MRLLAMLSVLAASLALCLTSHTELSHDMHLFQQGPVLGGTGNPCRYADVTLHDDRIAYVGRLRDDNFTAG
ncbi:MAG: hypothetical protein AAF328_10945 [Planctomycetota bacterium]